MRRIVPALLALAASCMIGLGASAPIASARSVFDADPGRRGLVVVDLGVRRKSVFGWEEADPRHGVLVRLDVGAPTRVESQEVAGMLVFAVEPGHWRFGPAFASLRFATSLIMEVRFPPDSLPELTQRVKAGDVVYVGHIESRSIPHPRRGPEVQSSVLYVSGRELEVLKMVQGKAGKSAWAPQFASRVATLEASEADTSALSAPADTTKR